MTKSNGLCSILSGSKRLSSSNFLARELGQNVRVSSIKRTRTAKVVDFADMAQRVGASGVGTRVRAAEQFTRPIGFDRESDVLEDVAFSNNLATIAKFKGMA